MNKETFSRYGWIIIIVLILAVMISFAAPFGNAIALGVNNFVNGFGDAMNGNAGGGGGSGSSGIKLDAPTNLALTNNQLSFDLVPNANQYILYVNDEVSATYAASPIDVSTYIESYEAPIEFKIIASDSTGVYGNSDPAVLTHTVTFKVINPVSVDPFNPSRGSISGIVVDGYAYETEDDVVKITIDQVIETTYNTTNWDYRSDSFPVSETLTSAEIAALIGAEAVFATSTGQSVTFTIVGAGENYIQYKSSDYSLFDNIGAGYSGGDKITVTAKDTRKPAVTKYATTSWNYMGDCFQVSTTLTEEEKNMLIGKEATFATPNGQSVTFTIAFALDNAIGYNPGDYSLFSSITDSGANNIISINLPSEQIVLTRQDIDEGGYWSVPVEFSSTSTTTLIITATTDSGEVMVNTRYACPASALPTPSNFVINGTTLSFDAIDQADSYLVYVNGNEATSVSTPSVDLTPYLAVGQENIIEVIAITSQHGWTNSEKGIYTLNTAGLYETETNYTTLLMSWNELLEKGIIDSQGNVVSGKETLLAGDLLLPDFVTTISASAYAECSNLTGFATPVEVAGIGNSAFYNCTSLASISIPGNTQAIDSYAFYNCTSLTEIIIPEGTTHISSNAFDGCTLLAYASIPQSVRSISTKAFNACASLASVTFAEDSCLTALGNRAFAGCSALADIVLPDTLTQMGYYVFELCNALVSINIPSSMTDIDMRAFGNCGLESIIIPNTVTQIGEMAFFGCLSLESVIFENDSQLVAIGGSAFKECDALKTITIPRSVKQINAEAFFGCSSLEVVTFEAEGQLQNIGEEAFNMCEFLKEITIPNTVATMGTGVFAGCTSLTNVTFESEPKLTEIPESTFSNCSALTNVTIPEGITKIRSDAFYNCTSLDSITLPSSCTLLVINAFRDCDNITSFIYAGTTGQWNSIGKGSPWISTSAEYVIYCIDGTVAKDGTITLYATE